MKYFIISLFLISSHLVLAQVPAPKPVEALNNYINFINDDVKHIGQDFLKVPICCEYTPPTNKYASKAPRAYYTCNIQFSDYFYNKALKENQYIPNAKHLNAKAEEVRKKAEQVQQTCQEIETYNKLKNYEDHISILEENLALINKMKQHLAEFDVAKSALEYEVRKVYDERYKLSATSMIAKAEKNMQILLKNQTNFLKDLKYNLHDEIHTGLDTSFIQKDNHALIKIHQEINSQKITLPYPLNGFYENSLTSTQDNINLKRNILNEYIIINQFSDEYTNDFYWSSFNQYHQLASNYNTFVDYARQQGIQVLKVTTSTPVFEIRNEAIQPDIYQVTPNFMEVSSANITITPANKPISLPVTTSLNTYVDFLNRINILANFTLINGGGDFMDEIPTLPKSKQTVKDGYVEGLYIQEIPFSECDLALTNSRYLPSEYQKSLNAQAQTVLNIFKEIYLLEVEKTLYLRDKLFEKDDAKRYKEIRDRTIELSDILNEKTKNLHHDITGIYSSYLNPQPNSPWNLGAKAMNKVLEVGDELVQQAEKSYKINEKVQLDTTQLDENLKELLVNKFKNLNGLTKLGPYNGNCPYTPYEHVIDEGKVFKSTTHIKGKVNSQAYDEISYRYNDMVEDYNSFVTLAYNKQYPLVKALVNVKVARLRKKGDKDEEPRNNPQPTNFTDNPLSLEGYATNNLVFLLDVSGSMNTDYRLPVLKESIKHLLSIMRPEDEVSIVVYSGKAKVLLKPTSGTEIEKISKIIDNLKSKGETDANAGIKLAYKIALKNLEIKGNNRIILATDGEFGVNQEVLQLIEQHAEKDIALTIFSFANITSSLKRITTSGHGNCVTINKDNVNTTLINEAKAKRKE